MSSPLISVIIPVYNVEKYLKQCLDSIVNQTLKDIEIICVDDGSTDSSLAILKEYAQKDTRFTILTQRNLRAGVARNTGLQKAKGKYLSFLDSDDFFELNMLEEMYNKAEKDQSDIVICAFTSFDEQTQEIKKIHKIKAEIEAKSPFNPKTVSEQLFNFSKPNPWTKLFRRSFFIENNLYFENCICCNDLTCVCTAMAIANKISILNKSFIYYRINQKTNITAERHKNPDSVLYALQRLRENLEKYNLYDLYKYTFKVKARVSFRWKPELYTPEEQLHIKEQAKQTLYPDLYTLLFPNNLVIVRKNDNKKLF